MKNGLTQLLDQTVFLFEHAESKLSGYLFNTEV